MAIPGTPEYHAEYMAKKRAAEQAAAAASAPTISPSSVGLDVPMDTASGTPVTLSTGGGLPSAGADTEVMIPTRRAHAEPAHGPDAPPESAASKKARLKEAGEASLAARGISLSPAQGLSAAETSQAQEYERAGMGLIGMQGAETVSSQPNIDYKATKEYLDTSRSVNDRAMEAQRVIDDAEMLRANKVADFMEEQNARQAEALTDMKARHFVQEEEDMEAQERMRAAYGLMSETTSRLMDGPDRWWASRSDGQKVGAFLGMLGRGMGGGNPADWLNERIDRELDALKSASAAAATQGNMAKAMYDGIRARTQDKREADAIYAAARAQQMKDQFEAFAARSAIPSVMAQQQQSRLALEQMIADRRLALGKIAARNVKSRNVVSKAYRAVKDPVTGQMYRVPIGGPGDVALGKYALERAGKASDDARKVLGEEVTENIKAGAKAQADDLEREKFLYQQKKDQAGGEKGAAVETALQLTKDYLADYGEDVPGRTESGIGGEAWLSEPGFWRSKAGLRESKRREALSHWYASALTGANVSEKQEKFLERLATDNSMSGDEIRAGLGDLQRTLEIYQSTYQRAGDVEAQAEYRGVDEAQLPQRDPKTGGMKRSNTGTESEAAALGGRLR